jgi:transposase InsO family protein
MKRPTNRKRHRPEEVVAKLRQADETLAEAKYLVDRWRLHYNHRRPQRALGKVTPAAYAANCAAAPPLRLAPLACAASPQYNAFPSTMHQLS